MSNIYSAKFMNEASATLASKVIKTPVTETYLFSTMNILREMNSEINNKTKQLYISISEAESKEDENKLFGKYFYEFKNIFENFSDRINQMKSRMVISIENKVETWDELIKDDGYITNFDKEFSYSGWDFPNIQNPNYPRLNLQKAYQKEFDYLGMLMQDKSIEVSPSAKMKIIATVVNNFSTHANNENWIRDVIKDMVDIDEKNINSSYSQCIYNALRVKHDINVDKGVVYTCRDNLCNYEDIIDTCTKMCDCLLFEVNKIAENISSYLFRNEDKKLKIKTDTDGVIDRDYRLDTYSMNQLDLFMKNKINQMRKILNIYAIALGIKFDTAVDYIDQCISILKTVKGYDDNMNMSDDTEDTDDNFEDSSDHDFEEPEDDEDTDDIDDDTYEDGDTEIVQEEEPEDDDINDVELSPYKNDMDNDFEEEPLDDDSDNSGVIVDDDTEEFEEAYLFESELFELEMMIEMQAMHESVKKIVLEDDNGIAAKAKMDTSNPKTQNSDSNDSNNNNDNQKTSNIQKLANKAKEPNIIQKLLNKLRELWKKFKEFITINSKKKIEYLRKNKKYIDIKVTGKVGLAYTANLEFLRGISIPDLNYEAMKDSLESNEKFYEKFSFYGSDNEGRSISDYIKEKALGEEQEATEKLDQIKPSIAIAYDFCINYPSKVQALDRQMQTLEKAERVLKSQLKESTVSNDFNNYFLELDTSQDTTKETKSNNISVYFRVCSQVIAAQMTVYQKLFNEFYLYCKWHIQKAGGSSDDATKEGENKDNQEKPENK